MPLIKPARSRNNSCLSPAKLPMKEVTRTPGMTTTGSCLRPGPGQGVLHSATTSSAFAMDDQGVRRAPSGTTNRLVAGATSTQVLEWRPPSVRQLRRSAAADT